MSDTPSDWSSWFVFHLCTCTCSNHPDQWSRCVVSLTQCYCWSEHGPTVLALEDFPNQYKNKHVCTNTHRDTQVEQCLPNRARSLIPASEWPRSPLEETQSTPTLAQAHVYTDTHKKTAPTPTELKTFIWQHQLTPDTHTVLPWPCSTSRLIKIVAGIRGVGTTGRESHSFCACVCVFLYVCVCVVGWTRRVRDWGRGGQGRHSPSQSSSIDLWAERRYRAVNGKLNKLINNLALVRRDGGTFKKNTAAQLELCRRGTLIKSCRALPARSTCFVLHLWHVWNVTSQ